MQEIEPHFDEDYYFKEAGFMVFTEAYQLKRGFCCQSGYRHCPYGFNGNADSQDKARPKAEPGF